MESIYTIDTAKLNKSEIDIVQFIESWLPTFDRWSVEELSYKCQLSEDAGNAAADMLILHGLLENAEDDAMMGRQVSVTADGALWMRENMETINSLKLMLDTDIYDTTEIAES
jgi:hypothetical protein